MSENVKVVALRNTVISNPSIQLWIGEIYELPERTVNRLLELGDVRMYSGSSENKAVGPPKINKNAAKFAAENEINISNVEGSGKGGRITLKDVKAFAEAIGDR